MRIDTIRCCTGSATSVICQDGSAESLYGADLGLWLLHGNCSATLGERARDALGFRLSRTIDASRTEQWMEGMRKKRELPLF